MANIWSAACKENSAAIEDKSKTFISPRSCYFKNENAITFLLLFVITNEVHITGQGFCMGPAIQRGTSTIFRNQHFRINPAKCTESATGPCALLSSQRLRKDNVAIAGYYIYPRIHPSILELPVQHALQLLLPIK